MDEPTAREYLAKGVYELQRKAPNWLKRQRYNDGDHDLPYAPEGVNQEYMELREMAVANWVHLAMTAPIQRCRAEGFRTGRDGDADQVAWSEVWQPNKLDARQRIVYEQMMVHGRGVMSVWPNPRESKSPFIRVENDRRVHIEPDPEDPFSAKFTVKTFTIEARPPSTLWVPSSAAVTPTTDVAIVYDADSWVRFEKPGGVGGQSETLGPWEIADGGDNPLGENPFVAFDNQLDADGRPHSALEPLIPAQDAINTIRFNTLLAMQFSAFRQRVFVGYDPVQRDEAGNPVIRKDAEGNDVVDANGMKVPVINSPGRVSVDRALVFPGSETKVFDLQESNLKNYIDVLGEFLTQLFAVGQIPPQYLLSRMANLSGDALAGAESTLAALVADLQMSMGESLEHVMRLANRARGEANPDLSSEVIWADAEARSFAQTIDAITKLVSTGFPREAAFEMIPGATPPKVTRWMDMVDEDMMRDPVNAAVAESVRAADTQLGA
ncbi:hypothetical protein J2X46_002708 [Nocardioides sp. BE266]|uniref:phage portal protein n=1 Tax=Nocardioides sp. BE266 TaxID=2817725 RepID=UPI0028675B11|nr:phage portal protein [Nocardioides sp. BE266]MDR7253718.1 hypothetical protein [Nocardioides sp. BE266]